MDQDTEMEYSLKLDMEHLNELFPEVRYGTVQKYFY